MNGNFNSVPVKGDAFLVAQHNIDPTSHNDIRAGLNNVYTKAEIDILVNNRLRRLIVESLPTENIDPHTIYMIKRAPDEQLPNDAYDDWIYLNEVWEKFGTSYIDLSDYQTKYDDSLTTLAKTIVGAINEINANVGNAEAELLATLAVLGGVA